MAAGVVSRDKNSNGKPKISIPLNQETLFPSTFTGIIVDIHEPEEIYNMLAKDKSLLVKREHLEVGDYAFANVGIERKQLKDFFSSLTSKRIWEQVYNLKRRYERPILVIEGLKDPIVQLRGSDEKRFLAAIATIALMGITVITLPTTLHFVNFVQYLYFKTGRQGLSMKPVPKKPWYREKEEIKEDVLCMLPGIGRKTAKAILARFPTIESLVKASPEELKQGTGLGDKRAKQLWEILHT